MDCRLRVPIFVLFLISFQALSFAQNQFCYYQLVLSDSGGDGWSGAALVVDINGFSTAYSLNDGDSDVLFLPLEEADTLTVSFVSGMQDDEVFFTLLDQAGDTLFAESGIEPFPNEDFSITISCSSCTEVPSMSVSFTDVRAYSADLSWLSPLSEGGAFLLRLGVPNFVPDTTNIMDIEAAGNQYQFTGLQEMTEYDLYIAQLCSDGDTSSFVGPYSFKTLWANDVAVVGIEGPNSDCNLEAADTIKVILQNFGGQPQTLIPFAYSINGNAIPIDMPRDGVYTGVLGKDSSDLAFFDRTFNFSAPGEYFIKAWTELESDSMMQNDTTELLVVSIPSVASLPYIESFEAWGGGWTIVGAGDTTTWQHGYPDNSILYGTFDGTGAWATSLQGNHGNNEITYLVSPCFDFSSIIENPIFSVNLKLDLEDCCDGIWLEQSVDGGDTWERVGRARESVNWYNSDRNYWTGRSDWFLAAQELSGLIGEEDVRLRFVFQSDFANNREGVLLDALRIEARSVIDLAATKLSTPSSDICGLDEQFVTLNIANTGLTPLTAFDVAYQVNNGEVIVENVGSLALVSDTQSDYTFTTPIATSVPGDYDIKAWIVFDDDIPSNDTAFLSIQSAYPLPFVEDFEKGRIPDEWSIDSDAIVTDDHNNSSFVLSDNLFAQDSSFSVSTPVLGLVRENDSLHFDYRFVDFVGEGQEGTTLGDNDRLEVFISTDCGVTRELVLAIGANNHVVSNAFSRQRIDLSGYVGLYIQVIFEVTYGEGDYWIDLDNIGIPVCGEDLVVTIESTPYINGGSRAIALVGGGVGPFSYEWSTGDTQANIVTPQDGGYAVTVTDALGCSGIGEAIVTRVNNIEELTSFSLSPNPSSGLVILDASFDQPVSGLYRIVHATGQLVQEQIIRSEKRLQRTLDLSGTPAGVYIVQLVVEGKVTARKLILSSQ